MPLSINTNIINKQRQKEVFDYLNSLLNDNTDTLYVYTTTKNKINHLKFTGFYVKENPYQYTIFQHTNSNLQDVCCYIDSNLLKFIIEKTPFFTESISLCVKNLNQITDTLNFRSKSFAKLFPATHHIIQEHCSEDELLFIAPTINILFQLNQYILGSNLIYLKNSQEKE